MAGQLRWVTGKGGVGKTRASLLLAEESKSATAIHGSRSSLLRESEWMGSPLSASKIWEPRRSEIYQNFLEETIKVKKLAKFLSNTKLFQSLLQLAPNLYELLLMQKWLTWTQENPSDVLIVDAPSTGNFLSLFEALDTARVLFEGGSLKTIAEEAYQDIERAENMEIFIVSIPEHSALEEMKQIETQINARFPKMKIHRILNRKHAAPKNDEYSNRESWNPTVRELAFQRPEIEDERLKAYGSFERTIVEGQSHFEGPAT